MAEFLTDPSVLTKDKLKSALVANNVSLPSGEQRKGVYVELYLKNLTSQKKSSGSELDLRNLTSVQEETFSSDEELPAPTASITARSGRKATRKTDRVRPEEIDVTELTNEDLKDQLLKYGVNAGPIVATTRKVYEKKLQRLLDQGPPQTTTIITTTTTSSVQVQTHNSRNGSADSDQYSDKEEDSAAAFPEPALEPEPVVERPLRSRGKTPVTTRTRSGHHKIEKLSAVEQTPKTAERNVLKELFPNEVLNTPTGISATPRQPIKGAAGRPFSDPWQDSLRPRLTEHRYTTSSYTESRSAPRLSTTPLSVPLSVPKTTTPPSVPVKTRRRVPVWVQLLLFAAIISFLLFVYYTMEINQSSPFRQTGMETSGK